MTTAAEIGEIMDRRYAQSAQRRRTRHRPYRNTDYTEADWNQPL